MNPRQTSAEAATERGRAILRRGVPYGAREQHSDTAEFLDQPSGD